MTDEQLTETLAATVFGWKAAAGRFIKPDRGWIPTWRFAPLTNCGQALDLLDAAGAAYKLTRDANAKFGVEVIVAGRIGVASGRESSRTIVLALARALEIAAPEDPAGENTQNSRARLEGERYDR